MEPLLSTLLTDVGVKTVTPDLFVPRGHQTKDFFQNIRTLLIAKKSLVLKRWQNFFQNSCLNALSTHEMYLRYIMFACDIEIIFSDNIFDRILSVFALVINFNIETLINSGVNFCELSVDIFMVFYKSALKKSFYMQGGFEQFAEYLRICHKELACKNYNHNDLEKVPYNPNFIKHKDVIESTICESLAKEVLSTTKIKLPTLTNLADLYVRLQAARQQKAFILAAFSKRETNDTATERETTATPSKRGTAEVASTSEMSERDSKQKAADTDWKRKNTKASPIREIESSQWRANLPTNSVKHKTHLDWLENIAETHAKYINTKCSDTSHANSRFHKEADKFLKQLKDMIITLIDALEDYDEE
ncbi:hypothetical protein AVEN_57830-1 [Araneus ventricosus]|uniref:Uncharacterized protein n=1 Tax=Araneus ventricosus TaxID=182803 RepID=A0A4Y2I8K7_ARAVE|nr:hypothetical protein AVEN_57830-1 [Araneus ventricosus]